MMKKIRQKIWSILYRLGLTGILSDEKFAKALYWFRLGRRLDLEHPSDFNEKIQWMKLNYHNPLLVRCADKYEVRSFVKDRVGEKYLNKCIGVYKKVEEIPYEELPRSFVLKATHGSGWNIVCADKNKLDWATAKSKMRKWLKLDFSRVGREWQYSQMQHRIICEEFLSDGNQTILRDYKVFTFGGVVKYIWVDYYKKNENGKLLRYRNFYDTKWRYIPGCGSLFPNGKDEDIERPECLREMIDVAERLGGDFPHCRVDFYVLEDGRKLVFGEMTFTCGNGVNEFFPQSFAKELGDCFELPSRYL